MSRPKQELLGIGIPLWFADKFFTKTGLDRVFDSLKKNVSYEEYLVRQGAFKNVRDFTLGGLAEWGLYELNEYISRNRLLDPVFDGIGDFYDAARNWTPPPPDPLALDLDGDGIETLAADGYRGALFDSNADGVRTATGWVAPDDGLLVLDRNGTMQVSRIACTHGDCNNLDRRE